MSQMRFTRAGESDMGDECVTRAKADLEDPGKHVQQAKFKVDG